MGQERTLPPDETDFSQREERIFSALAELYGRSALGTLVKGIVHNLNGSLQILSMQLELLQGTFSGQGGSLTASAQGKLERCFGQIEKVRSLLEILSRRGSEEGPRTLNVNELIEEELSFLRNNLFFKHEVEVKTTLGANLPRLKADAADLRNGLFNLYLNAVEAMEKTSRKELAVVSELESGGVTILIRDTGCGIPEAVRDRLFQPFFTTKEGHQGLGLFLARRFLAPWGGAIRFSSREGATIFSVRLAVPSAG
jgi:signal transduction histidine kinase